MSTAGRGRLRAHRKVALARTLALAWATTTAGCDTPTETPTDMIAVDTGDVELVAPVFVEPAGGSIRVASVRQQDLSLEVTNIDPAGSVLRIDGASVGALRADPAIGSLRDDALHLTMRGAMVPAEHTLQLQTVRGTEPLESEVINLIVRAESGPALTAALGAPQGEGEAVVGWGADSIGILTDADAGPATLTVVPLDPEGRWAFDAARTVTLPEFSRDLGPVAPAVSVQRNDDGDDLVVAWRQGAPGDAVAVMRTRWDAADRDTVGGAVLDRQADVIGAVEYAAWGRPWLAGDLLLAELVAATDTETPRPGTHAIVAAPLATDGTLRGTPRRLSFGERVDLDAIGPAIDLARAEAAGGPTLSLRAQQRRAIVVEVSGHGTTALRSTRAEDVGPAFSDAFTPVGTVVGALGSRLAVAASPEGLVLQRFVDTLRAPAETFTVPADDATALLEPTAWTSAPTIATVDGAAVVLLSQGTALPVIAVTAAGETPVVTALTDLSCDSIAAPPAPATTDGPLSLACARDGEVWDARLVAGDPR